MATTKAKPAAEVETETTESEVKDDAKPVTKSDVVEIVKSLLPGGSTETETAETVTETETTEPLTSRQEEARASNIVLEKIKELKDAFDEGKSKEPDKKEPETQPGKPVGRWIEKVLWGKE
jgi:hypothetical protein